MSVWTTAGLIADGSFDDPENARIVYIAAGGLLLLGVLLGVGTWLWWRSAKVEHPALAPLEVMGTRRWWKGDFTERRRRLDEVRPAQPADADADDAPAVAVDLDHVLLRDDPHSFDDLLEPAADAPAVAALGASSVDAEPELESSIADAPADADAVAAASSVDADAPSADAPAADTPAADTPEPEPVVADEPEPIVEPSEPVVEPSEPEPALVPVADADDAEAQPQLDFEPAVAAAPRSIVIDTAPRPRDTPSDLGPESVDNEPQAAPIDPLLRLQAE